MVIVGGLDLRGKEDKPSGIAFFRKGILIYVSKIYSDHEIITLTKKYMPKVLAIDSPLMHSKGFRRVDKKLISMGFKVLPPGWRGMRILVERAIRLRNALEGIGIKIIETHPRSSIISSGCSIGSLLKRIGLDPLLVHGLSKDELDALIAAVTAYYYILGRFISVSDVDGEIILLPRICE